MKTCLLFEHVKIQRFHKQISTNFHMKVFKDKPKAHRDLHYKINFGFRVGANEKMFMGSNKNIMLTGITKI